MSQPSSNAGDRIAPDSELGRALLEEAELLAPLGLDEPVGRWLLSGEKESVLREVARRPESGEALFVRGTMDFSDLERHLEDSRIQSRRERIRRSSREADPAVLWRLGRLYAAATPPTQRHRYQTHVELPNWLDALLWEASIETPCSWNKSADTALTAPAIVRALAAAGDDPGLIVDVVVRPTPDHTHLWVAGPRPAIRRMAGVSETLSEHRERVAEFLRAADIRDVVFVLVALTEAKVDPRPWIERLAQLACDRRKTVHAAAAPLVRASWPAAEAELRIVARSGTTDERLRALELLTKFGDTAARTFAHETTMNDPSKKVRAAAAARNAAETETAQAFVADADLPIPPRSAQPAPGPLTPAQRDDLRAIGETWAHTIRERARTDRRPRPDHATTTFDEERLAALVASIGAVEPWTGSHRPLLPDIRPHEGQPFCDAIAERCRKADWSLGHIVRLLAHTECKPGKSVFWSAVAEARLFTQLREARGADWDLRDLNDAYAAAGAATGERGFLQRLVGSHWTVAAFRSWGAEFVWPFLQEQAAELAECIAPDRPARGSWEDDERMAACFQAIALLPALPRAIVPALWHHALGTAKKWRADAQALLANEPDLEVRLAEALASGQQATRTVSAEWIADGPLGGLGDALEQAMAKERSDTTKAALLHALERCGRDVGRYLDRDGLAAEGRKLAEKLPKGCDWLGTFEPPTVRWADTGAPVDPDVIRGWLVKTARLKNSDPDPLLRRYVAMLRDDDRHALGAAVLEAWIAADTVLPTNVSDRQRRDWRAEATSWAKWDPSKNVDDVAAAYERRYLETPIGSATASKGVLALVAACGGPDLAGLAERYVRRWRGHRPHQAKALLGMLGWVDDRAATQTLLSIAVRFQTAGIRKEAERLATEVAARRGWTMDELADRTLPTAGFDDAGFQELCYRTPAPEGEDPESEALISRRIELRLLDDLSIRITRDDGKVVKALPDARQGEDAASVKAAKKALSTSRKAIQQIVKQQTIRLQEAMCTQRAWPVEDWRSFLAAHPVVGKLCRRLVWMATVDGPPVAYRPLEDGTLTSVDDEPLELPVGSEIRVAHGTVLGAETAAAWQQHLADFEVDPLFDQFPSAFAELPDDWEQLSKLETRKGSMTTAFKLRGRATKLGYTRGAAADAGWFTTYEKAFPSLGIQAVIEFTGNPLPEEERDVALLALYFTRSVERGGFGAPEATVPLGDVPHVLLDECRSHYAALAAEGSGFAADWEARSAY